LFDVPLRSLLGHVLEFCYPSICMSCQATAPAGAWLCDACGGKLSGFAAAPVCERCAAPLATPAAPCPRCRGRGLYPFERIVRLGVFEDPLKHLIHQMKYHKRWSLGEGLAERLFETEASKGLLTETQVLVPVPLYIWRHVGRGYNQADVIARRLGKRAGIPIVHAARRIRNTPTQTNLHSREKRFINVRGAFALTRAAARIRGKHVVVVDDVMTTGATLKEVGRTLKKAQPASLCAIVLAAADPKGRSFTSI
jgi:ComF family protein